MICSFLLIGQSNAAGRGLLSEAEPLDNCAGRLKILRNGLWVTMFRPINPDRITSGTSFAESFAKEYALAHENVNVGIIPCADGGTEISKWLPGEVLFENAVNCARLAMRSSALKGILWHQGESDCADEKYTLYEERFKLVMDSLREQLGCPDVPIIIGGLGDYLANFHVQAIAENYQKINTVLEKLGRQYRRCSYVSAEGLGANPDNLHFSAAALKEFGLRYHQAYAEFHREESFVEEEKVQTEINRSAMELL